MQNAPDFSISEKKFIAVVKFDELVTDMMNADIALMKVHPDA
jgi:hypothetical protein